MRSWPAGYSIPQLSYPLPGLISTDCRLPAPTDDAVQGAAVSKSVELYNALADVVQGIHQITPPLMPLLVLILMPVLLIELHLLRPLRSLSLPLLHLPLHLLLCPSLLMPQLLPQLHPSLRLLLHLKCPSCMSVSAAEKVSGDKGPPSVLQPAAFQKKSLTHA